MEHTSKETYFRNIYLFLERARDIASIKGYKLVRTNLQIYFKGPILEQQLSELTKNKKRLVKISRKLDEQERILVDRFRLLDNIAINVLLREKYILRDILQKREPREFIQKILRSTKDTSLTRVKNQLNIIYNGLDSNLRRNLRRLKTSISLNEYLKQLDNLKYDWWNYATRYRRQLLISHLNLYPNRPRNEFRDDRNNRGQYNSSRQLNQNLFFRLNSNLQNQVAYGASRQPYRFTY